MQTEHYQNDTLSPDKPVAGFWLLRSPVSGQEFHLHGEMVAGRENDCQIRILSGHISRYHAKFRVIPDGVVVEDLHSTNGTFVNGRQISAPRLLSFGDEVMFHTEKFRLLSVQVPHTVDSEATLLVSSVFGGAVQGAQSPAAPVVRAASVAVPVAKAGSDLHGGAGTVPDAGLVSDARPVGGAGRESPVAPFADADDESTRLLSGQALALKMDKLREAALVSRVPGSGPRLVVMTAPLRGRVLSLAQLKPGQSWTVGRDKHCELRVDDRSVFHDHARLTRTEKGWRISVDNARNALMVNGSIEVESDLGEGDRLLLGRMELVFATDVDSCRVVQLERPPISRNPWLLGGASVAVLITLGILGVVLL